MFIGWSVGYNKAFDRMFGFPHKKGISLDYCDVEDELWFKSTS